MPEDECAECGCSTDKAGVGCDNDCPDDNCYCNPERCD